MEIDHTDHTDHLSEVLHILGKVAHARRMLDSRVALAACSLLVLNSNPWPVMAFCFVLSMRAKTYIDTSETFFCSFFGRVEQHAHWLKPSRHCTKSDTFKYLSILDARPPKSKTSFFLQYRHVFRTRVIGDRNRRFIIWLGIVDLTACRRLSFYFTRDKQLHMPVPHKNKK